VTSLFLLEPESPGPEWAPFAGVRPIAELRAGIWRIRERWEAAVGYDATALLGDHAAGFVEADEPSVRSPGTIEGPALVGAAWFAPTGVPLTLGAGVRRLVHGEETVGWVVPPGDHWRGPHENGSALAIDGVSLRGTYDLLTALEQLLPADCTDFFAAPHKGIPDGSIVLGDPRHVIILGATVEPAVVFDVRHGAVIVDQGAEVRSGTRLEGPLYLGPGTRALGGFLRASVFGPECRVHGEVSTSVFQGFANKSHDGFVGHSVIGQWVNLGAGTTTSNLKNTYGPVRLEVDGARIETGRLNIGSLIGDHAKTAIGSMLGTGTVICSGANVFGVSVPKYVPPFAWGCGGSERMTEDGFLRVAERVMARRNVAFSPGRRESLRLAYHRSTR
jgi:UDP-N-acetylglucosamine diphosphorylase/glucosamine-1-phosphate N-acetyltransferase